MMKIEMKRSLLTFMYFYKVIYLHECTYLIKIYSLTLFRTCGTMQCDGSKARGLSRVDAVELKSIRSQIKQVA